MNLSNSPAVDSGLMPGAEPFFFKHEKPCDTAVLLIHGFTSSCHSMRELGNVLFDAGFDTQGILLPGHGTTPEDLERTNWQQWYEASEQALIALQGSYPKIVIAGQSMGGCLALMLAAKFQLNGVITIASGLKIFNFQLIFLPLIKHVKRFMPKRDGPDVHDAEVKNTEVHYNLMPFRSIDQLQKLLAVLRKLMADVHCPLLLIHGRQDHTFDFRNQDMIDKAAASVSKRKVILENTYHLATLDYDKAIVQKEAVNFVKEVCR